MLHFLVDGGLGVMSVLTVLLVALFFAAWKAPRWVKEIGLFALLFGFLGHVLGMLQTYDTLVQLTATTKGFDELFDMVHPAVLFGGLKVTLLSTIYGIIIYLISLVIRVIQKPRL